MITQGVKHMLLLLVQLVCAYCITRLLHDSFTVLTLAALRTYMCKLSGIETSVRLDIIDGSCLLLKPIVAKYCARHHFQMAVTDKVTVLLCSRHRLSIVPNGVHFVLFCVHTSLSAISFTLSSSMFLC